MTNPPAQRAPRAPRARLSIRIGETALARFQAIANDERTTLTEVIRAALALSLEHSGTIRTRLRNRT